MSVSNIDDLLAGGKTNIQPQTPEHQEVEEVEEVEPEEEQELDQEEPEEEEAQADDDTREPVKKDKKQETDEYGNTKEPDNEAIRDRLSRQARKHQAELDDLRAQLAQQNAAPSIQQAAQDFEYNPDESGDWQQQLASFVKQTVNNMHVETKQKERQQVEQQHYQDFQKKFRDGMDRFDDFMQVVSDKPIDDAMTSALRGIADPAAFVYAASKRQPEELERISKLRDPHARYAEMIRLEERMKRNKTTTKAPRPLERTPGGDSVSKPKNEKSGTSIEDLIAKSDAKKLANMKGRPGRR